MKGGALTAEEDVEAPLAALPWVLAAGASAEFLGASAVDDAPKSMNAWDVDLPMGPIQFSATFPEPLGYSNGEGSGDSQPPHGHVDPIKVRT